MEITGRLYLPSSRPQPPVGRGRPAPLAVTVVEAIAVTIFGRRRGSGWLAVAEQQLEDRGVGAGHEIALEFLFTLPVTPCELSIPGDFSARNCPAVKTTTTIPRHKVRHHVGFLLMGSGTTQPKSATLGEFCPHSRINPLRLDFAAIPFFHVMRWQPVASVKPQGHWHARSLSRRFQRPYFREVKT